MMTKDIDTIRSRAWLVALGHSDGYEGAVEIRGAWNDYFKGRGSTTARRVLRDGHWVWASPPPSRSRTDVQWASVYEGEIVAQFTLRGSGEPDSFWLVVHWDKPLVKIDRKKTKTGYRLSIPESTETIDVSDPYWR